jgi:hypothetical protein
MKFDLGHITKITVVNIVLSDRKPIYHYLILKKIKGEIDFVKRGEHFHDINLLLKKISTTYPILLHFTGKGILNRKVVFQENYQQSILLNANMNAFYFTDFLENNGVYSSVIRKDTVDDIVQQFHTLKSNIVSISSGPFLCAILNPILNEDEFTIDNIKLIFSKDTLVEFEKNHGDEGQQRATFLLGEERVNANMLICAAVGASFYNHNTKFRFPQNDKIFIINKEEAKQKNIFSRFGMMMMIFFLVVLFGNYLFTGHLNQVLVDNSIYLSEYDEQLAVNADLVEEINRKEALLHSSGLLNRRFLSFYLMELANSTPQSIKFNEIIVKPLSDEIKKRKKIAFEENLILVNGEAENSHVLSRWIEKIEAKDWLDKVEIISYEYVKNAGFFKLELVVL